MKKSTFAFCLAVVAFSIQHSAFGIAAAAEPPQHDPVYLKPLAMECYGLRGAVAVSSNAVVAVLGASATGDRTKADAWRIRSEEDPAYAYEKFVRPAAAKDVGSDVEFELPEGFDAPKPARNPLKRSLVRLELPVPLKKGVKYGLVVHGGAQPVTGGKSGCLFEWDGTTIADEESVRVPADDLAPRLVGLRRVSPLGDGKLALEFGASLSAADWRDPAQYDVRLNGRPLRIAAFGRRSKVDVYLPIPWPFRTLLEHDVYLDVGCDLKPGDRVSVSVGDRICSGAREASFSFDPSATISRSIQANQIGYLPDGPKAAYLGFWLGSFPEPPKGAASAGFDYSSPPSLAEAFTLSASGEAPAPEPANPGTGEPANASEASYDDLAPYAVRFREPPTFELVRERDGKTAFAGVARLVHNGLLNDGRSNHSAENVYALDFTGFAEPGRYHLRVPGVGRSIAFDIAADVYARPLRVLASGVFAQRCGFELTPDRAPGWRRIACHTNGVQPTAVNRWTARGCGPLRESTIPVPNPDWPAAEAARAKLDSDPALAARYPLAGTLAPAAAGAAPLEPAGDGWTWADDGEFGERVLRTGRKGNGLAGRFAIDPATGATATFWLRRKDIDGSNFAGPILRLGPGKGNHVDLDGSWGILRLAGKNWRRLGDDVWRLLSVRLSPADENGTMLAELMDGTNAVASVRVAPPATDEISFAAVTGDGAAGCHFRDLRLWSRPLSGDELAVLSSRAGPTIPKTIALRGGHHDAGDYNPRCNIDVSQSLLALWESAPGKFTDGQLDLPESGNGLPDIVDEALWALRPWISLQDEDGGVCQGTESQGDPNFCQSVELDPTGDYAYAKDCKGSFLFAGAFAQASRVLDACGRKEMAADYLSRARRAYGWGVENVPEGLKNMQQYASYRLDTRAYAAAELLHATGEERYLEDFRSCVPWSADPKAPLIKYGHYDQQLAAYAFLRDRENEKRDPALYAMVRDAVLREADYYIRGSDRMAYKFLRHPDAPINWGNAAYGVHIRPVLAAWLQTGDAKYRDWIIRTCDNMLGANPLGLSWISGLGERSIRAPWHTSRYRPEGMVVDGIQCEGPVENAQKAYNYVETVYPAHDPAFAPLHAYIDSLLTPMMNEGTVQKMALDMAVFGMLLPDAP